MKILNVKNIINKDQATIRTDGNILFDAIKEELDKNEFIEVDFSGIIMTISSFLNAAIGNLYGQKKYSKEFLEKHIKIVGLDEDDMELLQEIVIPNAISYFEDPERIKKIEMDILND